jgi:hypothetical protein
LQNLDFLKKNAVFSSRGNQRAEMQLVSLLAGRRRLFYVVTRDGMLFAEWPLPNRQRLPSTIGDRFALAARPDRLFIGWVR